MAAFLNISYDRVRIVGLRKTSRRVLQNDVSVEEIIIDFVLVAENGIPGMAS